MWVPWICSPKSPGFQLSHLWGFYKSSLFLSCFHPQRHSRSSSPSDTVALACHDGQSFHQSRGYWSQKKGYKSKYHRDMGYGVRWEYMYFWNNVCIFVFFKDYDYDEKSGTEPTINHHRQIKTKSFSKKKWSYKAKYHRDMMLWTWKKKIYIYMCVCVCNNLCDIWFCPKIADLPAIYGYFNEEIMISDFEAHPMFRQTCPYGFHGYFPLNVLVSNFSIFGGFYKLIIPVFVMIPSATTLQVLLLPWYSGGVLPRWPEFSSIQGLLKPEKWGL